MCGIAAIVFPKDDAQNSGAIDRMVARIRHRGPDADRVVRRLNCHLGHTRLSIIDLAGGDQPMADPTGQYWITFNGEIYNYKELRRELEQLGRVFRTRSDTEVLLQAFIEFGEQALTKLNGQFAFIIWDESNRRFFAARDRMGEKPLYWVRTESGLVMASELGAILASGLVSPRLDPGAVDAYLGLLYVPPNRTIYENIFVVPPGHYLTTDLDGVQVRRYWEPQLSGGTVDDYREVIANIQSLVEQAVRRQMVADVPVGAFLSGGLDSSTVVALMTKSATRSVATFSVGFGDLIDELPYARSVATQYGTQHHEIQMEIDVATLLERMASTYDEPFADSSNIPTFLISQFARRHVKAVLCGDGADEIFGGYDWYRLALDDDRDRPSVFRQWITRFAMMGASLAARLGFCTREFARSRSEEHLRVSLRSRFEDPWDRHLAASSFLLERRPLRTGWSHGRRAYEELGNHFRPSPKVQGLDRAVHFDTRCYLPGDILVKVDRAAMAHGLETRSPFLDVDLVEYVLNLPACLRFQGERLKPLLRESCGDLWPESIQQRSKQGFGAPIGAWLRLPEVDQLVRRVCKKGHALEHLIPGVVHVLSAKHPQRTWTVLCLGLWLERHPECLAHL
ncbi:asparagine synthase (glutamine-hydrolyzing) [bacterium]|nr:asparagine synthase (glutamine-hydrolyzing) [bacterium]